MRNKPTLKEIRDAALNELLSRKVYHPDLGAEIKFDKKGIKEMVYARPSAVKLHILKNIRSILMSARLDRFEKDKKNRPEIIKVIVLKTTVTYELKRYQVDIVLFLKRNGTFVYEYSLVKRLRWYG